MWIAAALTALAGAALLLVFLFQDRTPDYGARAFVVPDDAAPVPMRLIRGVHPVVTAEAGGRTLNLLVDTGTPMTMLPPSLADGPGDRGIERLCLANGICAEDLAVDFRRSNYNQEGANTYNGVLGADILSRFAVTFDYGAGTLRFGDRDDRPAVTLPLNADQNNKPRTKVVVGGRSFGGVLLDTGASYTRFKPAMVEALGAKLRDPRREIAYYLGKEGETEVFTLGRFCLSVACVSDIPVQAGDWAAVGGTFFRHFVVTFDFASGTLGLTPHGGSRPVNALERRGIQVDIRDPALVSMVTPGSATDRAGLSAGNRIAAIDGEEVGTLGYFGVNERLEAAGTITLTLEDGREIAVRHNN